MDVDVHAADTGAPGSGYGNAGGSTVFRLREGIERFLITEINNPGASAKAQSTVFITTNNVATEVSAFNHVPGGANVLYLDGHPCRDVYLFVDLIEWAGFASLWAWRWTLSTLDLEKRCAGGREAGSSNATVARASSLCAWAGCLCLDSGFC